MASRKTPAQKKADKKDWYATVETKKEFYYWRTSEKHYEGIDSECGVKVTKDLPNSSKSMVKETEKIKRRIPVMAFVCEDSATGENYTVYRRVNPSKIETLVDSVGSNSLKMNGNDPVIDIYFPNQSR